MPQITKDVLDAKMDELNKEHERCLATLNAIAGARQLLAQLQSVLEDAQDVEG